MPSPIYDSMNHGNQTMNQFSQFMRSMQGKNPQQEIDNLLRSGKISQQQLDRAQQMAQQMRSTFEPFFKR